MHQHYSRVVLWANSQINQSVWIHHSLSGRSAGWKLGNLFGSKCCINSFNDPGGRSWRQPLCIDERPGFSHSEEAELLPLLQLKGLKAAKAEPQDPFVPQHDKTQQRNSRFPENQEEMQKPRWEAWNRLWMETAKLLWDCPGQESRVTQQGCPPLYR